MMTVVATCLCRYTPSLLSHAMTVLRLIVIVTSIVMTIFPTITTVEAFTMKHSTSNAAGDGVSLTYARLAQSLVPKLLEGSSSYWIGIAGGPGSGKTTTATEVAARLNEIQPNSTIVIPMDGWHYPKTKLVELHGIENGMKRRGSPWTFDVEKCFKMIYQAKYRKKAQQQQTVDGSNDEDNDYYYFPSYDRTISDPIDDAIIYKPNQHRIVLCEGLYLLHTNDKEWSKLNEHDIWDERWFVKCPTRTIQINRLIERSLLTWNDDKAATWGPGLSGAKARVEYNDVKNMDLVAYCEEFANEVIVTE